MPGRDRDQLGEAPYAGDQLIETPAGERTLPFHIAYTMDEPRLELLATVPGTCWVPSTSGIHHLGYWSDDVDGDVATLVANGLQVEARAPNPDGSSLWAYCKAPSAPASSSSADPSNPS